MYTQLLNGKTVALKTRRPYREYIGWLKRQDEAKIEEFWNEYLHGILDATQLSFKGLVEADDVNYRVQEYEISEEETRRLQGFCKEHNVTANTLLIGALGIVLKRYLNQDEVVIGMTTSGRNISFSGIEDMVGLFINTLPVRIKFDGQTAAEYLVSLQGDIQELNEFGNVSLAKLQNLSGYGNNLFNVQFAYENYPVDYSLHKMVEISESKGVEKTEYPLSIAAYLASNELKVRYSYQTEHFDKNIIDKLAKHLEKFLEKVVDNPDISVDRMDILTEEEKKQQLVEWNGTTAEYPKDKCIHELFEEQVKKNPEAIAVVFEDKHLTYGELNAKSNQLARYLRKRGIKADDLVGICMEKSLEMLIGILGILKAGGAYVPLDPSYPKDRLDYMKSDSGARIIIDTEYLQNEDIWKEPRENLRKITSPQNLAYVIYTSGSTGRPKGVQINHESVVNYIIWGKEYYCDFSASPTLLHGSIVFDMAVTSTYLPLLKGEKIIIGSSKELAITEDLSLLKITPSHLRAFFKDGSKSISHVDSLLIGGEALSPDTVALVSNLVDASHTYNEYGPTETTVACSVFEILDNLTLIGKPISNVQMYILDQNQQLIPNGVAGEICIGGIGLARGYLNQPDLTAEKFIANPFDNGNRLYRTGDLGRYLPDGNIEFLGRIDNQVKIRGFRIELGEIESAINDCDQVRTSVALAKDGQLIVYIVPSNVENLEESYKFKTQQDEEIAVFVGEKTAELVETIRSKISQKLPEYMMPSYFVVLEKIPLTPNGKTDDKLLQTLDTGKILPIDKYIPPRNEIERKLCEIWQEILHLDKVGINDNFFKIGGDSILAIQVISRAKKQGILVSVKDLFLSKNISALSEMAEAQRIGETEFYPDNFTPSNFVPFVTYNQDGADRIFFFPPGEGGAESYAGNIIPLIEKKVVSFNNLYLFEKNKNDKIVMTYNQLASIYIQYINLFPQNDYTFVGWSFGGVLAFEITRVLLKTGKKIRLILIDSYFSFKHVVRLLNIGNIEKIKEDISYGYNKKIVGNNLRLKIILFKSTYPEHIAGWSDITNYYSRNTIDNFVSQQVEKKYLTVVTLDASHSDWIHKKSELKKIVSCINEGDSHDF